MTLLHRFLWFVAISAILAVLFYVVQIESVGIQ